MKRSAISEHLINDPMCGKNYKESGFSILSKSMNYCDLIKLEAVLIKLYKREFCKQNYFYYAVSLFS